MLDTASWQGFKINCLFNRFERGKANQTKLDEGNDTFYVGAKRNDNGVMFRCAYDEELISEGNCIVFICNGQGSVGFANYMDRDFIASTDLVLGYADWLNSDVGVFLATLFSLERPKYSFGRKWGRFLKDTVVQLPVKKDSSGNPIIDPKGRYSPEGYIPDWQFMEAFIRSLHHEPLTTANRSESVMGLNQSLWKDFSVEQVFDLKYGVNLALNACTETDDESVSINFVSRTETNNGVSAEIEPVPGIKPQEAGLITVATGGSVLSTFVQPDPFYSGRDLYVLKPKEDALSVATKLFLVTVLEANKFKFSYGRQANKSLPFIKLQLPILRGVGGVPIVDPAKQYHEDGYIPDWQFMEDYMRALPYGDRIPEVGES